MNDVVENQIVAVLVLGHAVDQDWAMAPNRLDGMVHVYLLVLDNLFDGHICGAVHADSRLAVPGRDKYRPAVTTVDRDGR